MGIQFELGPRIPGQASLDELEQTLIQSDLVRRFVGKWRILRGTAIMPGAAGFNPLRFGSIMSAISLLEVESADSVVFRLAARDLEQSMGYALRGLNVLDLVEDPDFRGVRAWRYAQVVGQPCGFYMRTEPPTSSGLVIPREGVGLPIASRPGGGGQVLICAAAIGAPIGVTAFSRPVQAEPRDFAFIDLGAGTPAVTYPP